VVVRKGLDTLLQAVAIRARKRSEMNMHIFLHEKALRWIGSMPREMKTGTEAGSAAAAPEAAE